MAWTNGTPAARGYGREWKLLRARILLRDGYVCQCTGCKTADRVTPATEVDHIIGKAKWHAERGNLDGVDDESNLQAINVECHKIKTAIEAGRRIKYGFDATGFPLDPAHPWCVQRAAKLAGK